MSEVWIEGETKPRGLCWCGCGQTTRIADRTDRRCGHIKGLPVKYIFAHMASTPRNEIFERHVQRGPDYECWLWTGSVDRVGYGRLTVADAGRRATKLAHRVSHELFIAAIPLGHEVDHLCRNTSCVNPAHLEAVTPKENQRRKYEALGFLEYSDTCPKGHLKSEENTYTVPKSGKRVCRACKKAADRARGLAKRARKNAERKAIRLAVDEAQR